MAGRVALVVLLTAGCAARVFTPPTDTGMPLPDLAAVQEQVFRSCRGVRTLQAELRLGGRAGGQSLAGARVHAGFDRPASMRLEGVRPFGGPEFILTTRGEAGTLLLPRAERVVRGERAEAILGALTGVALAPADLLSVLTGCVVPSPAASAGRVHRNRVASLDLAAGATIYLRRSAGVWAPVAARRDGWTIEYPSMQGSFPGVVRLRSTATGPAVDLTVTLSQIETNADIAPEAFDLPVPAGATPMTLDELREAGPLRGAE